MRNVGHIMGMGCKRHWMGKEEDKDWGTQWEGV